jgi:predicted phosphate transport protein (TIGR00153 family)
VLRSTKDRLFFELLERQAEVAVRAAEGYLSMVRDLANRASHAQSMADIEHDGDNLTHELQNRIAATFITPLDQEDLSELSHALDDVTDYIEAVASRMDLYRIEQPRPDLEPMAELLVSITKLTTDAVREMGENLNHSKTLKGTLTEMHTVENESDRLFRSALRKLFDEPGIDPLMVIKWKEVYDRVEAAVDRCEDVAKIIDNISVKYA